MFVKLCLLLYADYVVLVEHLGDSQRPVCVMKEYYDVWKLNVNVLISMDKNY